MPDHAQRVRVEEFDWITTLPFLRLFGAFRLAIHLPNLFLALLLALALWLLGQTMDGLWGHRAYPTEITQYAHLPAQEYSLWIEQAAHHELEPTGIFTTTQQFKLNAIRRLVWATVRFRFFESYSAPAGAHGDTVASSLKDLVVTLPGWLWTSHRWFFLIYGFIAMAIWAVLGGAIARSAALMATQGQRLGMINAIQYGYSYWIRFFLTPFLPLLLIAAVCVIPATYGAIFFNVPVLNTVGGLTLIVPLLCGVLITILLVLYAVAGPLFYAAIAIDGSDSFDAISRAFGYVLTRPWRWLAYNLMMLFYAAVTYFLLSVAICLTLWVTQQSVGLWVRDTAKASLESFESISLASQRIPRNANVPSVPLTFWGKATAGGIAFWVNAASMFLSAYAISFYFSANNLIYLLLRKSADGAGLDDIFVHDNQEDSPPNESIPTPSNLAANNP